MTWKLPRRLTRSRLTLILSSNTHNNVHLKVATKYNTICSSFRFGVYFCTRNKSIETNYKTIELFH